MCDVFVVLDTVVVEINLVFYCSLNNQTTTDTEVSIGVDLFVSMTFYSCC